MRSFIVKVVPKLHWQGDENNFSDVILITVSTLSQREKAVSYFLQHFDEH